MQMLSAGWVRGVGASYDDGGDAHHGEKFLFLSGLFSCHDFTLKPSIFHFHLSPHFFFRFIEIPFASQSDSVCFEQSIRRLEGTEMSFGHELINLDNGCL